MAADNLSGMSNMTGVSFDAMETANLGHLLIFAGYKLTSQLCIAMLLSIIQFWKFAKCSATSWPIFIIARWTD